MKHLVLFSQFLLLLLAASAEAHEGRNCLEQASRLDGLERTVFLKGCLASASAPANVQEASLKTKQLRCAQNAKNLALQGDEKSDYIKTCMSRNDAAEIAAARNAAAHEAHDAVHDDHESHAIESSAKAQDSHNCLDQSKKLEPQQRAAYLKACLAWASSPSNVQEAALQIKHQRCEQNAKNLALQGSEKTGYINSCMNRNEAASKRATIHASAAIQVPPALASTSAMDSDHQ